MKYYIGNTLMWYILWKSLLHLNVLIKGTVRSNLAIDTIRGQQNVGPDGFIKYNSMIKTSVVDTTKWL